MMGIMSSRRAVIIGVNLLRPQALLSVKNISSVWGTTRRSFSSSLSAHRILGLLNSTARKDKTNTDADSIVRELSHRLSEDYVSLPHLETHPKEGDEQPQPRGQILEILATEFGTDHKNILEAAQSYAQHAPEDTLYQQRIHLTKLLRDACTPKYEEIFASILKENARVGIRFFIQIRQDLLRYIEMQRGDEGLRAQLKQLDESLRTVLSTWFSSETLEIRRITYDTTSAAIMEKVATKEAVHPVRSLEDLKTRLGPDKRVFCAFHPLLPEEPLIFVHVALRHIVPSSMEQVLDTDDQRDDFNVAAFYSISSTQPGLSGVDLGHVLIKKATKLLQIELSSLNTFVTLSPIPRFRPWLQDKLRHICSGDVFVEEEFLSEEDIRVLQSIFGCGPGCEAVNQLLRHLDDPWELMFAHSEQLESIFMKLVARYLYIEKHRRKPLDGVARFHIQNGAELYRLNYMADTSRKGFHNSLGVMVNYRYNLETVAENRRCHAANSTIPINEEVQKLMK